jgi:hypothetical protein
MPPRFTFWTIIIDGQPTAFRAAEREELLPTLKQLQAKNPAAVLKWFARGRVWESPEDARRERTEAETAAREAVLKERRAHEWRPGGEHRDPREKFKKETFQARKRREKKAANLAHESPSGDFSPKGPEEGGPGGDRPAPGGFAPKGPDQGGPRDDRPRSGGFLPKGPGQGGPGGDRPRSGGFPPRGPGQGGPGGDRSRPGGWSGGANRPPGRSFGGGAQGGFRPKGPGQFGSGGDRPRSGGFPPKGPGQGGPGGDRSRPGGWSGGANRPPGRSFGGGAQGGFRPKGPGQFGSGGDRPRSGGWNPGGSGGGHGDVSGPGTRGGGVDRPPIPQPQPAPPPPVEIRKPAAPPERATPPVEPGPPAPSHKTRLPRLRKP